MLLSARVAGPILCLAIVSMAALVAGCASSPKPQANTPASVSELVDTAKFTKMAQDEGWQPEVRNGQVLYCMDEAPVDSRFPEKTCLDEASLQQRMLAEEHQRQSMQQPGAAGGCKAFPAC